MINDSALYDADYFKERDYGVDKKRALMYEQERRRIAERSNFGRILDVGCGIGDFLSGFDDRWHKYGIEPSRYAWRQSIQKGISMIEDMSIVESESMDVIVFRGTLQHISNPVEALSQAARLLKHGGLLVILATPDADSLVYQIWHNLPALDWPRNWIVFGSHYLKNIIQRLNFGNIEVAHPYWSTPYANPLFDFFNFFVSFFTGWRPFAFPGNMLELYARKK